jgi:outer membrane lipoprotein-sorting protein
MMRLPRKLALTLAVLLAPILARADEARDVLDRLLSVQEKRALTVCQVQRWAGQPDGSFKKTLQGRLWLKSGGRARLEADKGQVVTCDGRMLCLLEPESRQVMRSGTTGMKQSGQFFLDLAESIRYYSQSGKVALKKAPAPEFGPQSRALVIRSRDPEKSGFDRADFWLDKDFFVRQVSLSVDGQAVRIQFDQPAAWTEQELAADPKADLPDSKFACGVPEGYEAVDSLTQ